MTKKRKKSGRRPPATSSTTVPSAVRPSRPTGRGSLGGLFSAPPVPAAMSPLPLYRSSLGRGFLLVGSSPLLLLAPMLLVLAEWLTLLAFGYVGVPAQALTYSFALPPLSVGFDASNLAIVAGVKGSIYLLLPVVLIRAAITAFFAAAIVDGFETGRVSKAALPRTLLGLPLTVAMLVIGIFGGATSAIGARLGPGLGILFSVVVPAFMIFALGFLPFIAVTERRGLADGIRRSFLGARSPGGRHFMLCALYILVVAISQFFIPGSRLITASPSLAAWSGILLATYVHMGFFAAFGYRWLVAAPVVPEVAPSRRGR